MKRKVPFLDLRVTDKDERAELHDAIETVFQHGRFVMGPEVAQLETEIAKRCGRKYAVGVGSGTDALFLALKAVGIGQGDEVITTSLSWVATANAIALTGATPVFADIGDDLNIDPASAASLITSQTKAIVCVHFTGKVCAMDKLTELAEQHELLLIEDAAQAFGATLNGRKAGSFGIAASFSMNPMKVYAATGEAGAVVTDDANIYDRLQSLRYNGTVNRETCIEVSLNCRIDTLQAAMLLCRLKRVDAITEKRRQIAGWYDKRLANIIQVPREQNGQYDVYYTYTIQVDRRDELIAYLAEQSIETKVQHFPLMPQQPVYHEKSQARFTNAKQLIERVLCIPANEKLCRDDINYVAEHIIEFYSIRAKTP